MSEWLNEQVSKSIDIKPVCDQRPEEHLLLIKEEMLIQN